MPWPDLPAWPGQPGPGQPWRGPRSWHGQESACSGAWEPRFLEQNSLLIGHAAWDGYRLSGRGLLICHLAAPLEPEHDWRLDGVRFSRRYVARNEVTAQLRHQGLGPAAIRPSLGALDSYDPARELVVLLSGHGPELIALLRKLPTAPPTCFELVERRWSEFACAAAP